MAADLDNRVTFSVKEVCDGLGISESTCRRWIDNGELPAVRVRNRVLVLAQPLIRKILAAIGDAETLRADKAERENVERNERRAQTIRDGTYWTSEWPSEAERRAYRDEVERDAVAAKRAGFGAVFTA